MSGTILIIEDDPVFAESLQLKINETDPALSVTVADFDAGLSKLKQINPDVVVLDVFEGDPQYEEHKGLMIWDKVWSQSFTPLIFASASRVEEVTEFTKKHPLVNYLIKAEPDVIVKIVELINDFLPFGQGINEIRSILYNDAERTAQEALTDTAPRIPDILKEPTEGLSQLKSAARRRLSTQMRLKSEQERSHIFAWEQYLYPPPQVPYLLTGDILKSSSSDNQPEFFRVVVTPSCDLANCGVMEVLVAKCVPLKEYREKNNISTKNQRAKEQLKPMLTQAQSNGYAILPAYSDLIPAMAVSLRDLELLSIVNGVETKSATGEQFIRIISLDSPFREQMAWAYLQIACRPGMPDRNRKAWIDEIIDQQ